MNSYDVVVVRGGAAGLSAAQVLGRARRRVAVVDPAGRTSIPGVWAAGNAVDPRAQVITAASAGSVAAIAINTDLVDDDLLNSPQ